MKKIYFLLVALLTATTMQAQVSLLKDVNPGQWGSYCGQFTEYDGELYFSAEHDTYGTDLWKTDGTADGTIIIDAFNNHAEGLKSPQNMIVFNNKLVFKCYDSSYNKKLFSFDGTVLSHIADNDFENPQIIGDNMYFVSGDELWVYDGSAVSAVVGGVNINIDNSQIIAYGTDVLMYAEDSDNSVGRELYKYDTQLQVFSLVKNIGTFPAGPAKHGNVKSFTKLGDLVYFSAGDNTNNYLWETNGTEAGTIQVADANTVVTFGNITNWDGKIFYSGKDSKGSQLFVYDPSLGTINDISNIGDEITTIDHSPRYYSILGDYLYYVGVNADSKYYLYRTEGASIELVCDDPVGYSTLATYDGKIFTSAVLKASESTGDYELYTFAPTPTAIGDEVSTSNITIAPNPSYGMVNVTGLEAPTATYEIYDLTGKRVEGGAINSNQIDYSVGAGIYILKVIDAANTKVMKIVVK